MAELDPDCAHVLRRLQEGGWMPLAFDPPEEARERFLALSMARRGPDYEPEPVASVRTEHCDGLEVRVYEPEGARDAVVVWLHGGGWVLGDLDTHDPICRRLANVTRAVVAAPAYRLAPEHPFPAPVDDALVALRWAAQRWPQHVLAVGGDSAGGGLAAAAALRARDEQGPALAAQLLVYPAIDPSMGEPSIQENGEGYFLSAQDMRWFYGHYLPDPSAREHPYACVLGAPDLRDLPPAVVVTAHFDPLRDEGDRYAARLAEAGVPTRHQPTPGLIHGYLGMAELVPAARRSADAAYGALAELLDAATAQSMAPSASTSSRTRSPGASHG